MDLIENALTAATLRAQLAATGPAGWRARAITTYAEIANLSSQDEEAAEVLAEIVARCGADRELLLATMSELLAGLGELGSRRPMLEIAIVAARTETPAELARWVPIAIDLVMARAEDHAEDDEITDLIDELHARTREDRVLALSTRRALATGLADVLQKDLALVELREALEIADEREDQLAIALDLARLLRWEGQPDAAREVLLAWVERAGGSSLAASDRLAEIHLELAELDHEPEHHTRAAVAQLATSEAPELRHRAAYALGELLVARDALVEADELLTRLPTLATPSDTDALLEDVRRRRGLLSEQPPPEELVEDEVDAGAIEPGLIAFYTWPADLLAIVREDRLFRYGFDRHVREWSHGVVTSEADLDSEKIFGPRRSFCCACGLYRGRRYRGAYCRRCRSEIISSRARRWRAGHIQLPRHVLHPWYAPLAAYLLDISVTEVLATPSDELREQLKEANPYQICYEIEERLPNVGVRATPYLEARLEVARAFRDHRRLPHELMLDVLPVPPPDAEPELFTRDRASVRRALVGLIEGHDTVERGAFALFNCFHRSQDSTQITDGVETDGAESEGRRTLNDLVVRWRAALEACESLGGDSQELIVAPPASEAAIAQVERELGHRLPRSLRTFFGRCSSHVELGWELPEELRSPFREISSGHFHVSLSSLGQLAEQNAGWIRGCFSDRADPYSAVWHDKLPFLAVGNGDFIALDIASDDGAVIYLSHEGDASNGQILGTNFLDFVDRYSRLGCVGAEAWQWLYFWSPEHLLDGRCANAALWRQWFPMTSEAAPG